MDCTRFGKAVILRQKTEDMKLGLFAIGGAWLNYRKAKAEYEALEEKKRALQAAVDTYNMEKYADYDKHREQMYGKEEPNDRPERSADEQFLVSTILRVGNLVGKYMRVRGEIVMTNLTNRPIFVNSAKAMWWIMGQRIPVIEGGLVNGKQKWEQSIGIGKWLQPGETQGWEFAKGISAMADMGVLRHAICEAAGKRLITSCPKISIEGLESACFKVSWRDESMNGITSFYTNNQPGVLRYMMEAYYG